MNAALGPRLRDMPLGVRLVLACCLISVGFGYVSALVQLHFQGATAGERLPGHEEVVAMYHGLSGKSQLERLLTADESKPFNGTGSMRAAFTTRSGGLQRALREKAKAIGADVSVPLGQQRSRAALFAERDGERQAILAWIHSGPARQAAYENDRFVLPSALERHPITEKYFDPETRSVKIQSVIADRCARCHAETVGGPASNYPLDTYERLAEYCQVEEPTGGMSLPKLAQTTHVHLLSFSVLYGLTGLLFALTSYARWIRIWLAPLPLVAQVIDIACWWLARLDPVYADAIRYTGAVVGLSLAAQISLTLPNLFGWRGKAVLLALALGVGAGAGIIEYRWIRPYLAMEGAGSVPAEPRAVGGSP